MNFSGFGLFVTLSLLLGPGLSHASQEDPCNFNDGSQAFSYERVMSCYESVPFESGDRVNAVDLISAARERSDLREVLEEKYGWRAELSSLAGRTFDNDHDFQLALVDNHKKFFNPHWRYQRPYCYTFFLASFIPFDFGSALVTLPGRKSPQQIIFIESAAYLPELYKSFTGIDPQAYVGSRVVSINGVPVLDYFRDYGTGVYRFDENPSQGLNEILQNAAYSIRSSQTHDVPSDRAVDVFVLETRTGQRMTVEMPWVFAPRGEFGLYQWPLDASQSTEDFRFQCQYPSDVYFIAGGSSNGDAMELSAGRGRAMIEGAAEFSREIAEKRNMVASLDQKYRGPRASYFEAAPGQKAQQVSVIVPKNDAAVAYQLSDRATVIRLDNFVGDWKDEVIEATTYACQNSDRLIFDMRNNSGGYVDQTQWLVTHVLPARVSMRDNNLGGQYLSSNAGRNELARRMETWSTDPERIDWTAGCWWGYEAACHVDPDGNLLSDPDWYASSAEPVVRGGKIESLTREIFFAPWRASYSELNPIACPGKFTGTNLIIYSNGTGVSAGYFWPALMRPEATIVTSGGFVGEPIVFGVARGGAVWGMNNFEAWTEQYLAWFFGAPTEPLPYFIRNVDSFIEQPGSYMRGSTTNLFINDLARGDVHIRDVWSDSPETDGYVYGRVLQAVQSLGSKPSKQK